MKTALILIGAGGHGRVVAEAAQAGGYHVRAFVDARLAGENVAQVPVLPADDAVIAEEASRYGALLVVTLGDNARRRDTQLRLTAAGLSFATIVHPRASVLTGARLGRGTVVLAGAVVGIDTVVGDGVIINTAASLDHDNMVGDFAHLSPGVHCGGQVTIGAGAHLAVGVSVRNLVRIGAGSVVGVGAAVVKDVPDGVTAYGVPARTVK